MLALLCKKLLDTQWFSEDCFALSPESVNGKRKRKQGTRAWEDKKSLGVRQQVNRDRRKTA